MIISLISVGPPVTARSKTQRRVRRADFRPYDRGHYGSRGGGGRGYYGSRGREGGRGHYSSRGGGGVVGVITAAEGVGVFGVITAAEGWGCRDYYPN